MGKLSTNSKVIDKLLDGGIEDDVVTTVYGPAASGKTTLCLLSMISASHYGKVLFVDTEGGFSVERLKQLTPKYKNILEKTLFLKPTTFVEQTKAFDNIKSVVLEGKTKFSLVIVDTISALYRVGKEDTPIKELNKKFGYQLNILTQITRKKKIPVLITSQVYADFENKNNVNIVGGDIIKYASKCMIELEILSNNKRRAILIKHRNLPMRDVVFEIREKGFFEFKQRKGFRIFD